MCNYFSVGQESKVGYKVEQNRTANSKCNIFCYVIQGIRVLFTCKFFSSEKPGLWKLLDRVLVRKGKSQEIVFTSDKCPDSPYLRSLQSTLFVQNISSCLGGRQNPWQTSAEALE